jgi:hypothetical protein
MAYTLPADTHVAGDANHPSDHNSIVDVLKGMGAVYNVLNTAYSGGADPAGASDSTAAIQGALTAAISGGGGTVVIPPGTYKTTSTITGNLNGADVQILAAPGAQISYYGSGDCLRIYDSSTYTTRTAGRPGIFGGLVIDGTHSSSSAASTGLHAGDILQLGVYVTVQNFTGFAGSTGVHFDNTVYWTEQCYGRIYAQNCISHVVFDCSGANTSSGSYARADLQIYIDQSTATNDGVVLQNGAIIYDGALSIRGNFNGSASSLTSAVLRITGTVPAGHVGAGNYAQINACRVEIDVEAATGFAHTPATIVFGASGNRIIYCYGSMDFSAAGTFTASSGTSNVYTFNGAILGDANLNTASGYPSSSTWNAPGGLAIGNFAGAQSLSNGSTITTAGNGKVRVTNSGNVTGIIMGAGGGGFDGQVCCVINAGTGSVTFAASGSNVSGGSSVSVAAGAKQIFVWDTGTSLWY